jgi:hypothetical protein
LQEYGNPKNNILLSVISYSEIAWQLLVIKYIYPLNDLNCVNLGIVITSKELTYGLAILANLLKNLRERSIVSGRGIELGFPKQETIEVRSDLNRTGEREYAIKSKA